MEGKYQAVQDALTDVNNRITAVQQRLEPLVVELRHLRGEVFRNIRMNVVDLAGPEFQQISTCKSVIDRSYPHQAQIIHEEAGEWIIRFDYGGPRPGYLGDSDRVFVRNIGGEHLVFRFNNRLQREEMALNRGGQQARIEPGNDFRIYMNETIQADYNVNFFANNFPTLARVEDIRNDLLDTQQDLENIIATIQGIEPHDQHIADQINASIAVVNEWSVLYNECSENFTEVDNKIQTFRYQHNTALSLNYGKVARYI